MNFFLGSHMPSHLARTDVPLFISRRRLMDRKTFPRAAGPWALDSGGFTELDKHGGWSISARQYAGEVRCYSEEIGQMSWAAPQDWMCEPSQLQKTGLTVREHQRRTVDNYLLLRMVAPDLPFVPVLQGWDMSDYLRCLDLYERAGVDLFALPVVGLGSVCRRQGTQEIDALVGRLAAEGLKLHGFGVKTLGIHNYAENLVSSDSLAWSRGARYEKPMSGHTHKNCANCLPYALRWRKRLLDGMTSRAPQARQMRMAI